MPRLLELWRQGRLKLDHLITGTIKFSEINEGFARLKSGAPGAPADRLREFVRPWARTCVNGRVSSRP